MRGSGSCLTGRWGGSDVTRGFGASVSSFSKKIHGSGSSVHPSNRSHHHGKLTMKPTIYLPEPRIPRGWLVEAIKQWRAQRIKGKSTKALHVRLEALKARYSKA